MHLGRLGSPRWRPGSGRTYTLKKLPRQPRHQTGQLEFEQARVEQRSRPPRTGHQCVQCDRVEAQGLEQRIIVVWRWGRFDETRCEEPLWWQFFQNILSTVHQFGALFDQRVAASRLG